MKFRVIAIKQVVQIIEAVSLQEAIDFAFFNNNWKMIAGDDKATLLGVSWEEEDDE